jgi:hypothetical protein
MNIIPKELVEKIEFTNPREYDKRLFALGVGLDEFYVINPIWPDVYKRLIDKSIRSRSCVMWVHETDWIIKRFHKNWTYSDGYKIVELSEEDMPQMVWTRNPAIDDAIFFKNDPQTLLDIKIPRWDIECQYIWHLDPAYCNPDEKIWIYTCETAWAGTDKKDMGNLVPDLDVNIIHNTDLIDLTAEVNFTPHYSELAYEHIWYIDPKYTAGKKTWIVKMTAVFEPAGVKDMGFVSPEVEPVQHWELNPDIPASIKFNIDYIIPNWDTRFKHVWYLDPKHCDDKQIWVYTCHTDSYDPDLGTKDMGYLVPDLDVNVIHNTELIGLEASVNYIPLYSDFAYEHIWYIDPKYTGEEKTWIVKMSVVPDPVGIKDMGYISPEAAPEQHWEINPDIPECIQFETDPRDYIIPNWDSKFKHIWYLNPDFVGGNKKIWIYTCTTDNYDPDIGIKDMGYITQLLDVEVKYNPEIPDLKANIDYAIKYSEVEYKHVWYVDPKFTSGRKIWLASMSAIKKPKGTLDMGYIIPDVAENLDVVFISYNEVNAEANWKRVLSKAPNAKRIDGVKGIFEAHKAAAKLATSDVFYVVDGDAYLEDTWEFDFNPNIFDRDCVHVYRSRNPVNNLTYGYGGVKLFPRKLLLEATDWNVDMTTSIASKLKVLTKISNVTAFNTDPLSTWRSAFRECAKLAAGTITNQNVIETERRLKTWMTVGKDQPFGEYALAGAQAGYDYGMKNKLNTELMKKINNRDWLEAQFKND